MWLERREGVRGRGWEGGQRLHPQAHGQPLGGKHHEDRDHFWSTPVVPVLTTMSGTW